MRKPLRNAPAAGCGAAALVVAAVFSIVGCDPPPRPELREPARTVFLDDWDEAEGEQRFEEIAPPRREFAEPWESRQAYYFRGHHVGFNRVHAEPGTAEVQLELPPEDRQAEPTIRITVEDQVVLRRGRASIIQRLDQSILETAGGELISFTAELRLGPTLTRFSGQIENGRLVVNTYRGSQPRTHTVPWEPHYRGLVGLKQSLTSDPMDVGEQRRLQVLAPIRYTVATIDMDCQNLASIAMPDGTVIEAREIEVSMRIGDDPPQETLVWTDSNGNILKSYTPGVDLVAFASDAEAATAQAVPVEQIAEATSVAVTGRLDRPDEAVRVEYRLRRREGADASLDELLTRPLPGGAEAAGMEDGMVRLTVSRMSADRGDAETIAPGPADSRAGPLIDSNDSLIKRLADSVAKKDDPIRAAGDLAGTVRLLVRRPAVERNLRAASQTARNEAGGAVDRAMLLAAMLRARGIPARVAFGLVYDPEPLEPRMRYHAWTLAFLDDRWQHLDSAVDGGFAPADRLAVVSSSLAEVNEYELTTPILRVISNFDIEIVDADYDSQKLPPTNRPAGVDASGEAESNDASAR